MQVYCVLVDLPTSYHIIFRVPFSRCVQVGDDKFKVGDSAMISCYGDKEGVCRIEELFENVHTQDMEMRVCWYYQLADVIAQFGKKRTQKIPCLQDRELFFSDHKQLLSVECISRKALVLDKEQHTSKPMGNDTFLCQRLLNTKDCSFQSMPLSSSCLQDVRVRSPQKRLRDESPAGAGSGSGSCNGSPCQPKSPKRKHLDGGCAESNSHRTLPRRASRNLAITQIKHTLVREAGGHSPIFTLAPSPPIKGSSTKRPPKAELKNDKSPQGLTRKRPLIERKVTEMTPEVDKLSHNQGSNCQARKSLRLSTAHVVDLVTSVGRDLSYSPSNGSTSDTEDESNQEIFCSSRHSAAPKSKRRSLSATPSHHFMTDKPARPTAMGRRTLSVLKKRSQPVAVKRGQDKDLHSVQAR